MEERIELGTTRSINQLQNSKPRTLKRELTRALMIFTVYTNLYSYFQWQSLLEASNLYYKKTGDMFHKDWENLHGTALQAITILTIPIFIACLISDVGSVDPNEHTLKRWFATDDDGDRTKKILNYFFKIIGLTSFVLGGLGNYIFFNDITAHIEDDFTRYAINSLGFLILGAIGTNFNCMFNMSKIERHVDALLNVFRNPKEFATNLRNHPLGYSAAFRLVLVNAIFRAINYGFLTLKFGNETYDISKENSTLIAIAIYEFFATIITTLMTRSLPSIEEKVHLNLMLVSRDKHNNISFIKKIAFLGQALLEASSGGILLWYFIAPKNYLNIIIGTLYATLMTTLFYKELVKDALLKQISSKSYSYRDFSFARHLSTNSNSEFSFKPSTHLTKFDQLAQKYDSRLTRFFSEVANKGGRGNRFVIFPMFFYGLVLSVLGLDLPLAILLLTLSCIALLIMKNDMAVLNEDIPKNLTRQSAKFHIEYAEIKAQRALEQLNSDSNQSVFCYPGSFFKRQLNNVTDPILALAKALTKGSEDYSTAMIEKYSVPSEISPLMQNT